MLLTKRKLDLSPTASSVRLARSWVTQILTDIGRGDLVDSAELGVSELVTNALIHSQPPLSIRLRGTRDHPRIEVLDGSPDPPRATSVTPTPDEVSSINLTTFGRGLTLVAMMSRSWGADLSHDGTSKAVWFEPAAELRDEDADLRGVVFGGLEPEEQVPTSPTSDQVPVLLLRLPATMFGLLRRYHFELRREMRLLSMSAPGEYPLAVRISETFADGDRQRRQAIGISRLDKAILAGEQSVDLQYYVSSDTPETMGRIRDQLEEAYDTFSDDQLLAMRPPQLLTELQTWYFTEFEKQGRGEPPTPWTGPLTLDP